MLLRVLSNVGKVKSFNMKVPVKSIGLDLVSSMHRDMLFSLLIYFFHMLNRFCLDGELAKISSFYQPCFGVTVLMFRATKFIMMSFELLFFFVRTLSSFN